MSSLTIVHVISAEDVFGPEKTTLNECLWLNKKNCRCIVINIWNDENVPIKIKAENAGVEYISLVSLRRLDLNLISKLKSLLQSNNCQLVHSHGYKADLFTYLATRKTSIRRVTTIHGWTSEDAKVLVYEWLQSKVWRLFDRVYAVSQGYFDIAIKKKISLSKMRLIYNGIIVDNTEGFSRPDKKQAKISFGLNPDMFVVSIIGRLSIEKGHDMFIDVAAEIVSQFDNVQFAIVGDGVQKGVLKKQIENLGLENRVFFLGHCDQMQQLYDATDAVAICSHREGLPNVLLEAMLNEIPVVSVKVGGVPEVIEDGKNGLIVSSAEVKEFSGKLMQLINDREFYMSLSQDARNRIINNFSFEKRMTSIYEEYISLIGGV